MSAKICSVCKELIWKGRGRGAVYQVDKSGKIFHPSCGAREYKNPVKEVHIGLNGRILKGGIGRAKIHYGLGGPVCNSGLPRARKSIAHVLSPDPKQVTCAHCKSMIDLRDKAHVLHLKRNLKKG